MWRRLLVALLSFFALSCLPVAAQEACEQSIQDSYLSIRDKLTSLKANSERVTEQLTALSESLELSQQEAATWKQTWTKLYGSWTNINEQLEDCYATIEQQQATIETQGIQLKKTKMKLLVCMGLLILMAVPAVVTLIKFMIGISIAFYANGDHLPGWLSHLLRRSI
jgi:hypothetical protein